MAASLEDRLALRELADRYARAVDRRDWELAATLFTAECVLQGPGYELVGRAKILAGLRLIDRYSATQHSVHNQLVEVDGDRARGETYCTAHHVYAHEGRPRMLDWGIRYQDRCVREAGAWRYARRELLLDWAQDLPLVGSELPDELRAGVGALEQE
ncbi:MAG TPA: nuclear transport factor 2 family protein [Myxococcota bacterium]|nr:nuclear transport factor 2 family protein [Myxococcota bacterium]